MSWGLAPRHCYDLIDGWPFGPLNPGSAVVHVLHNVGWLKSDMSQILVAQWLELLVQFRVVRGLIPCEVILLFGYLGYVSWHMDLTVRATCKLRGDRL